MEIKATIVFQQQWDALNNPQYRFIRHQGGSRSSKTWSICQSIIIYCMQNPGKSVSIIRKTFPALRASVMRDFFDILKEMDMYSVHNHSKSENIYNFPNGSLVEFFSADDEQKLRGRKRDIAWINEANELLYDDFVQINLRTTDKVITDFNPSDIISWVYDLPDDQTLHVHSTYKDNPFLSKAQQEQIEDLKRTDDNLYRIFCLGERGLARENVYQQWQRVKERPIGCKDFIYGIDFGYSHPTALVKIWFDTDKRQIYIEELLYESGLTSEDLILKLADLKVDRKKLMVADYARPEIISSIRKAGYQVVNADKSVKAGIDAVKTFEVLIDHQALNVQKENSLYRYKKIGEQITEEVVKAYDDAMDAIRYAVMYIKTHYSQNGLKSDGIYKFSW
jgi:phage terminase large subunit